MRLESETRASPPNTRISGVRILGTPLSVSAFGETRVGPIELSSRQNSLDVDFAALDYRSAAPLRFQFRILGQEQSWRDLGAASTVHLVNLAPGRYTLEARARSADGT